MNTPAGNLAVTLGVTDPADWIARRDNDPHLWATVDFLMKHGRIEEAIGCLHSHIEHTAYVRSLVGKQITTKAS